MKWTPPIGSHLEFKSRSAIDPRWDSDGRRAAPLAQHRRKASICATARNRRALATRFVCHALALLAPNRDNRLSDSNWSCDDCSRTRCADRSVKGRPIHTARDNGTHRCGIFTLARQRRYWERALKRRHMCSGTRRVESDALTCPDAGYGSRAKISATGAVKPGSSGSVSVSPARSTTESAYRRSFKRNTSTVSRPGSAIQ